MDNRAVSVAITHALAIGITTVLLSGLFVASGTLLDSQENRVGQDQLDEIGADVATHVQTFDRLNQTGTGVNATVQPDYADRIVNTYSYQIELTNESGEATITVRSDRLGRASAYTLEVDTKIESGFVRGGTITINLCSAPGEDSYITLGACDS